METCMELIKYNILPCFKLVLQSIFTGVDKQISLLLAFLFIRHMY